jgi:hypothetical protein
MAAEEIEAVPGQESTAQERFARIQARGTELAADIAAAVLEQDWKTLGYGSPDAWREALLAGWQLTADVRRQVVEALTAAGKTAKEIASATGTPLRTVQRDVSADPAPNGATPFEQGGRNVGVTIPTASAGKPATGAQRAAKHREKRRRVALAPGTGRKTVRELTEENEFLRREVGSMTPLMEKANRERDLWMGQARDWQKVAEGAQQQDDGVGREIGSPEELLAAYLELDQGQRAEFLESVPELVAVKERMEQVQDQMSDPAWLRARLGELEGSA